jgi:predicted RNA-binding Zn ribbon-like protein
MEAITGTTEAVEQEYEFSTVGGALPFDFVNTVGSYLTDIPEEHLNAYDDLLRWALTAGALDKAQVDSLAREAESRPQDAERVLKKAIKLRGAIHAIFSAVATEQQAPPQSLEVLNDALRQTHEHLRLRQASPNFSWEWVRCEEKLDSVLWPVARSAAEMLIEGDLTRVNVCASDTCGWLFLDTSKNRSRRWCDMSDCGNRAKARRHYHRHQRATSS